MKIIFFLLLFFVKINYSFADLKIAYIDINFILIHSLVGQKIEKHINIIEEEKLMENAKSVGNYAIKGLKDLSKAYEVIGDVRGEGLFFGVELVLDRKLKTPAKNLTNKIVNEMKEEGVLLSKLGINYNTLKIRPPMSFSLKNADFLLEKLDKVLLRNKI